MKQLRDPSRRSYFWWFFQTICLVLCKLFLRLRTFEKQHVPATGGVLFVANHQSFADPVLVAVELRRPVAFLARHGLFKNPFFGWFIRNLHAFPVQQGKGDIGAIKQTVELLRAGWALNIFPEGERTPDGELKPAQRGSALVIRKAKVPVVPLVIDGAFDAWPRHQKWPRPGKVGVLYGPPIDFEGVDAKRIPAMLDETFARMLADLRERMAR